MRWQRTESLISTSQIKWDGNQLWLWFNKLMRPGKGSLDALKFYLDGAVT